MDALLSLLPILWLVLALSWWKMPAHKACLGAFLLALLLAAPLHHVSPRFLACAALEGVLTALWPICLVILAALFTYRLCVATGAMNRIKAMLTGVSPDKRMLVLLIGWGFGNFMEGMAGFGTAVAIPASMLAGLGLNPLGAALGCFVVNSTPTAFGSVGVPMLTLASVTGLDQAALDFHVVLLQALPTLLSPFLLVALACGSWRALRGMLGPAAVAALAFLGPWLLVARFIGPELPDIAGSVCSMAAILACARLRRGTPVPAEYSMTGATPNPVPGEMGWRNGLRAWAPFLFVFLLLTATSSLVPAIHRPLASLSSSLRLLPATGAPPFTVSFSWVVTPGVLIFLAAVLGGLCQRARPSQMARVLGETLRAYAKTVLTICAVLATAKVMGRSGMIADIAQGVVAVAGPAYPFLAPAIGALGAFVTGSGTSTCVLFGELQAQTASSLGFLPEWAAAANVFGAGIGKMVSPQCIAIGAGAIGLVGSESRILRAVFRPFLLYLALASLLSAAFLYATA